MWLIAEPAVNGVCKECGSEEHSYSYSRCARCYVRKLLTEILTDPATGRVLSGMARGQLPISHDPFSEQFPMDRRHNYLRDFSTGVLPPYTPAIERSRPERLAHLASTAKRIAAKSIRRSKGGGGHMVAGRPTRLVGERAPRVVGAGYAVTTVVNGGSHRSIFVAPRVSDFGLSNLTTSRRGDDAAR
jgi:hypothetical protein